MNDLESCWDEIRQRSPIRLVKSGATRISDGLEVACQKTAFDLTARFRSEVGSTLTTEQLGKIIAESARLFLVHWRDHLASQDLAGLIEIVLEDAQISAHELTTFMQALPSSLLERCATSTLGSTRGVHALSAIELARRNVGLPQYTVTEDGGRKKISFHDHERDSTVSFYADEEFDQIVR